MAHKSLERDKEITQIYCRFLVWTSGQIPFKNIKSMGKIIGWRFRKLFHLRLLEFEVFFCGN
jgi:hypothetical protein